MTTAATPRARSGKYGLSYSIYGERLDVDALLAEARPLAEYSIWRKGDVGVTKRPAVTSGIRMEIAESDDAQRMARAAGAFLKKEADFIRAAGAHTGEKIWSELSCRMWVFAAKPAGVWFPPGIIQRLGELGALLNICAYPCADRED